MSKGTRNMRISLQNELTTRGRTTRIWGWSSEIKEEQCDIGTQCE